MSQTKNPISKHGLGRGFDSLLPQNFDTTLLLDSSERIHKIDILSLVPNTHQPRREFNEQDISDLALSIKRYGILQPLVVSRIKEGEYEIIAGERRWRAARLAGLKSVPAIVRTAKEMERLEIALVENVQRVDLSALDQAASMEKLHQQFNLSYDDIAKRLNKAVSTVINIIRLLNLPADAQEALKSQKITEGHARQILSLKNYPDKQKELLDLVVKQGWSVRQAERFVTAFKSSESDVSSKIVRQKMSTETAETKQLGKTIKAPVSIRRTAHGGKLEISFKDEKDLSRLLAILTHAD